MKHTKIKVVDSATPCSVNYFVPSGLGKNKRNWVKTHDLYEANTNLGKRVVTPVVVVNGAVPEDVIYMMDAVTGSLYDIVTGKCLTSHMVYMKDFTKKPNLQKRLLELKSDAHRGIL